MLGLQTGKLKFVPYNPEYSKLFKQEQKLLKNAVGSYILDIQHIGSTSIPGIIAKPILDIAIAVSNFELAKVCIKPIEHLGYVYLGEYGLARRHFFIRGVSCRTHNIHIWEINSHDWKRHLLFRDYLIKHPEVAKEYVDLKLKLLEKYQHDRDRYQDGKSEFIESIERLAALEKDSE